MQTEERIGDDQLKSMIDDVAAIAHEKAAALKASYPLDSGSPVFTIDGQYTSRAWTEWTQGFRCGMPILVGELAGDSELIEQGKQLTLRLMPEHLTHMGVHDHGFNIVSTYGALWRLMNDGMFPEHNWERRCYEQALKVSGAVQASRWTAIADGRGFIYSFNGPHSLFADSIRSLRSLAIGHQLGHTLLGEQDERISLLHRLLDHASVAAEYLVYWGENRDAYDVRGRVAHEAIFNTNSGQFRSPATQQGYSPFSTWMRALAWIMLGFAEQLEWLATRPADEFPEQFAKADCLTLFRKAAEATCDFYIDHTPTDGIPYWDSAAPGLSKMGDYLGRRSDPFNDHEPVDSSAAAIAAQALLRLGDHLGQDGLRYADAGRAVARSLFTAPYLSKDPAHQGLILHGVYHRPNGWDEVHEGLSIPNGESCIWGDYHAVELALHLRRQFQKQPFTFFNSPSN